MYMYSGLFLPVNVLLYHVLYTVEPPNKGHFGDNINSDVLSFVEIEVVLSSEVQNVLEL